MRRVLRPAEGGPGVTNRFRARAGLRVAEGTTGAESLRLTKQHQPDVLVLDVNLPDVSGTEITWQLRERDTTTAILVLTAHDDDQTVFGLLENGATGYVLKDEALETLSDAVRAVASNVILTDALPSGVSFERGLSNLRC